VASGSEVQRSGQCPKKQRKADREAEVGGVLDNSDNDVGMGMLALSAHYYGTVVARIRLLLTGVRSLVPASK